jgi:hypothetical protein
MACNCQQVAVGGTPKTYYVDGTGQAREVTGLVMRGTPREQLAAVMGALKYGGQGQSSLAAAVKPVAPWNVDRYGLLPLYGTGAAAVAGAKLALGMPWLVAACAGLGLPLVAVGGLMVAARAKRA